LLPLVSNPRLHRSHVEAIEWDITDEGHQILQPTHVVVDAPLVLVLQHDLRSRLLERA
jgi:hypothetical protein